MWVEAGLFPVTQTNNENLSHQVKLKINRTNPRNWMGIPLLCLRPVLLQPDATQTDCFSTNTLANIAFLK